MKTPNTIENEIDKIRLEIYEKTKDMTPAQRMEYYRKSGERATKKFGFKIYANAEEARRDSSVQEPAFA